MYKPTTAPALADQIAFIAWIEKELLAIGYEFLNLDRIQLKESNTAPLKPRAGQIVFADGTNWNPGSGAGFYGYHSGGWSKLG